MKRYFFLFFIFICFCSCKQDEISAPRYTIITPPHFSQDSMKVQFYIRKFKSFGEFVGWSYSREIHVYCAIGKFKYKDFRVPIDGEWIVDVKNDSKDKEWVWKYFKRDTTIEAKPEIILELANQ